MIIIRTVAEKGLISVQTDRFLMVLFFLLTAYCSVKVSMLATPVYILEVTRRFCMYKTGEKISFRSRRAGGNGGPASLSIRRSCLASF